MTSCVHLHIHDVITFYYILECDILAILNVCNILALCICIYICIMYRFFIFVLCIYIYYLYFIFVYIFNKVVFKVICIYAFICV